VDPTAEELLTNIHSRDHLYELRFVTKDGLLRHSPGAVTNAGAYSSYPLSAALSATGGPRMLVVVQVRNLAYKTYAVTTKTCPSGPTVESLNSFFCN